MPQHRHRRGCSCLSYRPRVLISRLQRRTRLEPALDECQGMMNDAFSSVGVVLIFVNAGAALVPTIVASLTSIGAVLLKPKELLALFRRKPWVPVAVILIIAGLWFGIAHLGGGAPAQAATTSRNTTADRPAFSRTDWTALALKLIRDKENANK